MSVARGALVRPALAAVVDDAVSISVFRHPFRGDDASGATPSDGAGACCFFERVRCLAPVSGGERSDRFAERSAACGPVRPGGFDRRIDDGVVGLLVDDPGGVAIGVGLVVHLDRRRRGVVGIGDGDLRAYAVGLDDLGRGCCLTVCRLRVGGGRLCCSVPLPALGACGCRSTRSISVCALALPCPHK